MIMRRRWLRIALVAAGIVLVAGGAGSVWAYLRLRASLPMVEGTHSLPGLGARVTVDRDALGIPTIRGASREDVARATGFLHAQERFFQMDLNRRRAAGELSALVGGRAIALDVEIRRHRFRALTERALPLMNPQNRGVLDAYTAGVNDGLAALGAPSFEYLLLGQRPEPWRAEDSLLVVLSMFITLQDTDGSYEAVVGTMRDVLPPEMFAFMLSAGTEWDAPIAGQRFAVPAIPDAAVYNLRARRAGKRGIQLPPPPTDRVQGTADRAPGRVASSGIRDWGLGTGYPELGTRGSATGFDLRDWTFDDSDAAVGSNNWAVAGRLTPNGGALLANDMHLSVRVPNIWYRAVLEWTNAASPAEPHRLIGITLPGAPAMVVGSNTHVAWGFTNTYADWGDIILLELDPANPSRYRTPDGWREFERYDEVIRITNEEDRHEPVTWTIWGPVLGPDHRNRLRAYRWVAHSAERLATAGTPFEDARTIEQVFDAANGLGTPGQNIVAVDRSGRIGWSIYGSIPRRVGFDDAVPVSWADGTRSWDGWLTAAEYPRVIDPDAGRIWTANARVVDGEMLTRLGDGSYEVGSRATIIRDRLLAKDRFTPADMLDIQLDTRAMFLDRWRTLILQTLTPRLTQGHAERARFRELVEKSWDGKASPDSVGYRLTRLFRDQVSERVMAFVLAECYEADWSFDHTTLRRREGPIWKLVTEKPMHLLDPQFASWDELFAAAVDTVIERTTRNGELQDRVWSEFNVTTYRHPLSAGIPVVGRWLDMPAEPLPGDLFTPRVQWGALAASERMVVSPGREAEGIMQMPTGQSGHPLSPYYANSHVAWTKGERSPFLPGPAEKTLVLTP
jgi:penicillin amidase